MGVHGDDWVTSVRAKLGDVAARYERFGNPSTITEEVDIVPITYDHVFTDQLERWREADDLRSFTEQEGIDLGQSGFLFDWLSGATDTENNFFWSHVVDILLYRYVRDVKKQVRLDVMRDIAVALADRMEGGTPVEATVVAHSLGTAVAHDSLHLLGSLSLDGSEAFMAKNFTFTSLFTLANVSRVLQTAPGPYESVVHPVTEERPGGYLRRYFNFRHVVDPFSAVRPFSPVGWASRFHAELGLDFFRDFNVHDFAHYLDSPRVHIPLLKTLVPFSIPTEEAEAAVAAYPRVEGIDCLPELDAFAKRARQIVSLVSNTEDPKRLVIAGAQFLAAAKEALDAC